MEPMSPIKRSSHSRSSSSVTAADFATSNNSVPPVPPIPAVLPASPVLNAAVTNVSSTTATRKLYRQSAGPRLTQVKANIGLPRVRTTSITQQKDQQQQQQQQKSLTSPQLAREKPLPLSASSVTSKPSSIPLPPSQNTVTTNSANNVASPDGSKKSLIKPPAQRGPGSTLRLRSMLAKRGQVPPAANKPPTMKN
jgi:hypothetical protein